MSEQITPNPSVPSQIVADGLKFPKFINNLGIIPTSYKDSMSYYETLAWLCKYLEETVIPTVNQNGEAVEELQNLYVELNSYVTHYFDNLDVQEEINNKLDEMTTNGVLQSIVNQFFSDIENTFTERYNDLTTEVNTELNEMNNMVQATASGSPAGVYNTVSDLISANPNHSKIYLVLADGKWYYYSTNNSTWVAGGTYQTTGIGNKNITYSNLFDDLQDTLESVSDLETSYSNGFNVGKYINASGVIQTNAVASCLSINVEEKETYKFNSYYDTSYMTTNNPLYVILDENNNVLDKEVINVSTNEILTRKISMPHLAKKLVINATNSHQSALSDRFGITAFKIKNYNQANKVSYNQLDSNLKEIFKEEYTNFSTDNLTTFKASAILNPSLGLDTINGYTVYSLNVVPGEKFKFNIYRFFGQNSIFCGSKDSIFPITIDDITYNIHGQMQRFQGEVANAYNDIEFTVPEGCDILYINNKDTETITIKKVTKYKVNAEDVVIGVDNIELNPLSEKILLFNGDSITQSSSIADPDVAPVGPNTNRGWVARIKVNSPNSTIYGYGASGTTIAKRSGRTDSILERTATMYSEHSNADYIILQGGINDMFVNVPLGTITSGYNDTYDDTTFCGALESLFRYVTLNFKGKKCGFINMFKVPSCANQPTYNIKLLEICKKWQIPVLNLYEESDLNFYLADIKAEYSQITDIAPNGDGLHPNTKGYNLLQNKVERWIKSL